MIVIVDYRTANLGSIINMFKRIGAPARVAEQPSQLEGATRILLPGIGHFDTCARNLRSLGFADALQPLVMEQRTPLLGICVGAQLLTHGSEEGNEPGLGWIDARTLRFPDLPRDDYRVPHMGWNIAEPQRAHYLFGGFDTPPRFYFVHSYYMTCSDPANELARTVHGVPFASAILKDHVAGVQFHPEKSHRFGMQLLRNFASGHDAGLS
ncbi:MAG: imidazole glycerol phosphate synthase subunit HisH [Vicinamibacterales bacterium]